MRCASAATKRRSRIAIRRRAASRKASRAAHHLARATRSTLRRLRRPALVIAGVALLASALGAGTFAASGFYGQYGAPRTPESIRSWQLRPASYAASDCRGCHTDAAAAATGQPHAQLLCESCHVPSVDHPGPVKGVVQMLAAASNSDCAACHAAWPGRPLRFPTVTIDVHYAGAGCLRCHDPHSSVATKPREVSHPLANLPSCATCHAPLGLKVYPANHEPAADEVCLACHKPGAGGP
ncbi:MAG: hypothetical protein ABI452_01845 [Candidatus Limnocylindrales bacterium]